MAEKPGLLERIRGNAEWEAIRWLYGAGRSALIACAYWVIQRVRQIRVDFIGLAELFVLCLIFFALARPKRSKSGDSDGSPEGEAASGTMPDIFKPLTIEQQELVIDKVFVNEVVVLDGKRFLRCKFNHSTFRFNGTASCSLDSCEMHGGLMINSENPAITVAWQLMTGLGLSKVPFLDRSLKPMPGVNNGTNFGNGTWNQNTKKDQKP